MSLGRSPRLRLGVVRTGALGLAVFLVAAAAAPASPRAAHPGRIPRAAPAQPARPTGLIGPTRPASQTIPRVDTVQVGPITAGDGFRLYLTAQDCGAASPYFQIAYRTGNPTAVLTHTYTGIGASCTVRRSPAGAELSADLPGVLDVAVRITGTRTALAHPGLPVGCGPPFGPELPATATGQIDVAIHPGVFGAIAVSTASAQIFSGAPQTCPGPQSTAGTELTAEIGSVILDADQPTDGHAQLDVVDDSGDSPAPQLQGVTELELSGPGAFSANATDGSASVGSTTRLTAGSLAFVALPACPGAQAQNGTLSGTLTLTDPLLGSLQLSGDRAGAAFMGPGTAQPGVCNGPGSEPVMPELVSSCDSADAGCSVGAGTAGATLFDETDPGTQAITAETVDFGDGSSPVPITNFSSVQHAYTTPGTYTATLTVTDALGAVASDAIPVVIDP